MYRGGYIYIMTNKHKNMLYIGVTSDLKKRIWEHRNHIYKNSFNGMPINDSYILSLTKDDSLILNQFILIPDVKIGNIIIEFDGEYWHKDDIDMKKDCVYENHGFICEIIT